MSIKSIVKRGLRRLFPTPKKIVIANILTLPSSDILKDRIAIVTGGTGGIGKAIAIAFANAGADVIITSRNYKKAIDVAKEINKKKLPGTIYGINLDVSQINILQKKFNEIIELVENRPISILVNNAGVEGTNFKYSSEEEYDKVMDTNLKGAYFISQIFTKYIVSNQFKANILNIVSSSGIRPAVSSYMVSKWGLRGLTEGLARILAPRGIVVNGIAPGPTATSMQPSSKDGNISWEKNLIGRMALPEEIANMAVFLVSDMGRTIVGDIIYMSGGGGIITNEDFNYQY